MKRIILFLLVTTLSFTLFACDEEGGILSDTTYEVEFMVNSNVVHTEELKVGNTVSEYHYESDYYLSEWYTDSQYKNKYDFTSEIYDDLTLYAKEVNVFELLAAYLFVQAEENRQVTANGGVKYNYQLEFEVEDMFIYLGYGRIEQPDSPDILEELVVTYSVSNVEPFEFITTNIWGNEAAYMNQSFEFYSGGMDDEFSFRGMHTEDFLFDDFENIVFTFPNSDNEGTPVLESFVTDNYMSIKEEVNKIVEDLIGAPLYY